MALSEEYAAIQFEEWLTTGKVQLQASFRLPANITPKQNAPSLAKSLYAREEQVNNFEFEAISAIAQLDNVLWWHRNLERTKGFEINGFINHYPDFVVLTKNNNLILVETKGGHLDNSNSMAKLKLGKMWENKANLLSHETGLRYHYMMVFEGNPIEGTFVLADALRLVRQL